MGERMTRRRAIGALGTVGVGALLAACAGREPGTVADVPTEAGGTATVRPQLPTDGSVAELLDAAGSCTLTPEAIEGPFHLDLDAIRSDIRDDREGVALRLAVRVEDADCRPVPDAVVDIWSCDAAGLYSGFESVITGSVGPDDARYLRGAQVTNADGIAELTTIYPGWYPGRAVHVHAKVLLDSVTALTAQLYFDEAVTDRVHAEPPYADRGDGRTRNDADVFFARESGERSTLALVERDGGWLGVITLGLAGV
jgi:protocatechuate 3,4-dioxygenase beta subunit